MDTFSRRSPVATPVVPHRKVRHRRRDIILRRNPNAGRAALTELIPLHLSLRLVRIGFRPVTYADFPPICGHGDFERLQPFPSLTFVDMKVR